MLSTVETTVMLDETVNGLKERRKISRKALFNSVLKNSSPYRRMVMESVIDHVLAKNEYDKTSQFLDELLLVIKLQRDHENFIELEVLAKKLREEFFELEEVER